MQYKELSDLRDIPRLDPRNTEWGFMVLTAGHPESMLYEAFKLMAGQGVLIRGGYSLLPKRQTVKIGHVLTLGWPGGSQGVLSFGGLLGTIPLRWGHHAGKAFLVLTLEQFLNHTLTSFNDG